MSIHDTRSLPELLSTLVNEMSTLFRQEIRLARTETSENIGKMTGAMGMLAAAGVLMIPAIVILLQAISAFLVAQGMEEHWALLVVSLVVLLVGVILLSVGLGRLKASHLAPDRTLEQVRRDALVAREQIR
ncbi:phage holin family protein [Pseudaminobacter sp. 19-2017]|uniref:Phage holin family protein n=1 Tax=Pseudaminobacter soli (ex Zhang et al. 2022) TaxID=2831468 RepID=A0A942DUN5_9HYPH|nr:phage holin family protein [Pseudaminobacter soli]MBS3647334.1 phage holin family protein [Pseudaminobacter soli]